MITDINMAQYKKPLRNLILYANAADNDENNGIGPLPDVISCDIMGNLSEYPTLQAVFPIGGTNVDKIEREMVIMGDCDNKWTHQKFRINHVSKTIDGITVDATHVSGDLAYNVTTQDIQMAGANATQTFEAIKENLAAPMSRLTFDSDVTDVSNVNLPMGSASNLVLDPDQEGDSPTQSLLGLFGGEMTFDNYHYIHRKHIGEFKYHVIKYGKDLQTATQDENIDNTYTGCFFYATYQPQAPQATQTNTDWANWITGSTSQGSVTYAAGGTIDIYDSPVVGHNKIGTVSNGQKLQLGSIVHSGDLVPNTNRVITTVNGNDWYPIAGGGWIDATWINFDKTGDYIVTGATGQVTVDANGTDTPGNKYPLTGSAIVTYYGNGDKIHVYYSPFTGPDHYRTGETLKNGQQISFDYVAINYDGNKWYRIGSHKWLYGPHLSLSKTGAFISYPSKGYGYLKKNSTIYTLTTSGAMKKTGIKFEAGYYELNYGQVDINGTIYYNLGGGNWVQSSSIDESKRKTVMPTGPDELLATTADNKGKVEIYATPDTTQAVNWALVDGTTIQVLNTAQGADGKEYYYIEYKSGCFGYIPADGTTVKNNSGDVAPYVASNNSSEDDAANVTIDQEEVRVTLPEGTMYADNCYDKELARVTAVDLSSYFTHDSEDEGGLQPDGTWAASPQDIEELRRLGKLYMQQHNIGQPEISLTVTYEDNPNELSQLTDLSLGDTIGVEFDALGIRQDAEVTSFTYDFCAKKFTSINLGTIPKSFSHLLLDEAEKNAQQLANVNTERLNNTQSMLGRYHHFLQLEGEERKQEELKMMKEMGLINEKTDKNGQKIVEMLATQEAFEKQMAIIDEMAQESHDWIHSSGVGVIHATPNWAEPLALYADTSDGGKMYFSANGLEYCDRSGNTIRASIDSHGQIIAESIAVGTITAVNINALNISSGIHIEPSDSSYQIDVGNQALATSATGFQYHSGSRGVSVRSSNYTSYLSSGALYIAMISGAGWDLDDQYFKDFAGVAIHPDYLIVGRHANYSWTVDGRSGDILRSDGSQVLMTNSGTHSINTYLTNNLGKFFDDKGVLKSAYRN